MDGLTEKQKSVLDFIIRHDEKTGYPPTVREVAGGIDRSVRCARDYLLALRKKGFIQWEDLKPRTITVLKRGA